MSTFSRSGIRPLLTGKVFLFHKHAVDHAALAVLDLVPCVSDALLDGDVLLGRQDGQDDEGIPDAILELLFLVLSNGLCQLTDLFD